MCEVLNGRGDGVWALVYVMMCSDVVRTRKFGSALPFLVCRYSSSAFCVARYAISRDLVHTREAKRTPAVPRLKLERDLAATADILLSGGRGCRDAQRSARRDAT